MIPGFYMKAVSVKCTKETVSEEVGHYGGIFDEEQMLVVALVYYRSSTSLPPVMTDFMRVFPISNTIFLIYLKKQGYWLYHTRYNHIFIEKHHILSSAPYLQT